MKQEATKKTPKWLLPVIIAAAVLVVAGILLAIFLPGLGQGDSGAVQSKLYWNVDRDANIEEESGMSIRTPGADGLYAIRFAVDGEQVEYKTADKRLVNAIDMQDLMGLVFDADGLIADILDPKAVATEVAKEFFVKEQKGNTLVVNSSQAMNGMPMQIEITENTGIYNVTDSAEVVGQKETTFQAMDKVTVYANEAGENTHIFIVQRFEEAGVYYRLERMYNAELASTTREPDENGVYTVGFAYNGEQVDVKFKDKDLVDTIDAGSKLSSPQMGLLFDEEGYAIKKIPVEEAIRGKQLFGYWHVTDVAGTTVSVESRWSSLSTKGETGSFELPEDFDDIFLMETECGASHAGVRVDSLQKDDCVYVYTDFEENPLLIFVIRRNPGYPLYYNLTRKYSSTTLETTRKPDENGYYVFEVAGEGKTRTVKTKDKAIATKVDMQSRYLVGLKLEGDIIVDACSPVCVTGRATAGTGRYVTELLGTIVRMASAADMASGANYVINPECKVYDVSDSYGIKVGSETELRVGDRVQAARNPEGELVAIYVYARYEEGTKIHFNPSRLYDSKTKQTTREKDAEGYYVYQMCSDGKWVTVKTKSKAMATFIDKQSSKFVALRVSNGIIKGAYNVLHAIKYGYATMKNVYYSGVNSDGKFTYYTKSNGVRTDKVGHLKAANCIVYNTSSASYIDHRGEKSTLQKDDYIYAFGSRENFQVTQVWIRGRDVDGPLYWGVNPQFNDATGETARTPAADGYYYIDVVKDGKIITLKTKDKTVASKVDDYNYAFGLLMKGDEVLRPVGATSVKGIEGYAYRNTYVKAINGNKAILCDTNPSSADFGKDLELVFTKSSKIYDVSSGAETFGQATELKVGDKIASYQDEDGKVVYCFIRSRGATFANCEACYKQAIAAGKTDAEAKAISLKAWSEFSGGDAAKNEHYYLNQDFLNYDKGARFMIYSLTGTVCLDLNGHKVTMAKAYTTADGEEMTSAAFRAYSNGVINLMDSKGTAVVEGYGYSTGGVNSGCAVEVRGTGILNIYGGTFKRAADAKAKVAIGCHTSGYTGQINIYGGTFDSIYARAGGKLTLAGAPKISSLTVADDFPANIDGLKPQAEIKVNGGNGKVLTAPSANAAAVKNCFVSIDGAEVKLNNKNELVLHINIPDFTENAFTTDFDPAANAGYGYCEACFKNAIMAGAAYEEAQTASLQRWIAYDGTGFEKNQHYYLTDDYSISTSGSAGRFMPHVNGTTCWNLNGHSVTMEATTTYALTRVYGGTMNIMDAKGTGTLTGYQAQEDQTGAVIELRDSGTCNIFGGNLRLADGAPGADTIGVSSGETLNVYGGIITGGVDVREGATLTLSEAPQISGLKLKGAAVANIDALLPEARIIVEATAGKIFTAPSTRAEIVKNCFTVESGLLVQVTDDDCLKIANDTIPWTANALTTDFDPAANRGLGYCEACYKQALAAGMTETEAQAASLKTWTVFTGGEPEKNEHYYLTQNFENYSATARFMDPKSSGTYCWNLNGKTVTMSTETTEALSRATSNIVLNIMDAKGTGVLAGYEFGTGGVNSGATVEVRNNGIVNIYGGNFRRVEGSSANVAVGCHSTVSGQINIYGGTFDGIYARADVTATLAGTPQITNLGMADGVVVNIDGLLPAAQITVKGNAGKVISNVSANAAAVAGSFTTITQGLDVAVNAAGALEIVEDANTFNPETAFTTEFKPAENNGYAYCEACYKQALAAGKTQQEAQEASYKQWTVYDKTALGINSAGLVGSSYGDSHFYLAASGECADDRLLGVYGVTICFNLNGHSITKTAGTNAVIRVYAEDGMGILNLMDAKGTGTLTGLAGNNATRGSVIEIRKGICNIYGGNIRVAENTTPEAITVASGMSLNIYGGNIEGGVIVNGSATLTLSGTPVIAKTATHTGLTLNGTGVANIDGLLPEAQIAVEGAAGKVISNVSTNAAAVKDCFTAGDGLDVAVGATGALEIVEDTNVFDPETAFTTEFKPAENNGYAYCEACYKQAIAAGKTEQEAQESSLKQWTAFTGGDAANGRHYYLAQNFENYSATSRFMNSAGDTNCWNLNGKTVTMSTESTEALCRVTTGSLLNIMDAKGTGVLAGYEYGTAGVNSGTAVEVRDTGILNIYGGNFRRVDGSNANVAVGCHSTISGQINIYGGTFDGIYVRTGATANLVGAPQITNLGMTDGVVVNIDGLLPQAQISVKGDAGKVISNVSANAAAVANCFTAGEGLTVAVNGDGALAITEATVEANPAQFVLDWVSANSTAFRAEGKLEAGATVEAPCPFCSPDAAITWTGIVDSSTALADGCHVYLIGDRNKNSGHNFLVGSSTGTSHCVYFNGFNVGNGENTSGARIRARGGMNIIAYGSTMIRAAGSAATATYGTMMLQGGGVANIYGGTFINNDAVVMDEDNELPVSLVDVADGANISFYDATLIGNVNNAIINKGTLSLYNCTVTGAEGKDTIKLDAGTLNIHNGTVNGNIAKAESANLVLTGTPVIEVLPQTVAAPAQQGNQEQDESSEAEKN